MRPAELIYACNDKQTVLKKEDLLPCFNDDHLGCWLWHQHCQVEPDLQALWWMGKP